MLEEKILQKLTDHDIKLAEHDVRFDRVEERLDKLTHIVIEHGERLEQTVTKAEFTEFKKMQADANDQMITILKRLDEERFATCR